MSARNIKVFVTVTDGASRPLRGIEKQLRNTNKAVQGLDKGMLQFNKTLFTTTALIGTLMAGFKGIGSSLESGANLERVENQFVRIFGKNSNITRSISNFTDAAVDDMEAMSAASELANLGLVGNISEASDILAMGAAAARRYGKESSVGIKAVTEFMKDHNIQHLQQIGILTVANKEYLARQGILGSVGKSLSGVIKSEDALNMGMAALRGTTKDSMFGLADLRDLLTKLKGSFTILGGRIGVFLGKVFGPMLVKFTNFAKALADNLEGLTKNSKKFMEISEAVILTTTSIVALTGSLIALKLIVGALGSLGFGIPKLIMLIGFAAAGFSSLTHSADGVLEKLKLFKAFIQGVWQLITRFDKDTGISKLDKDIADMLRKNGLLTLAENVARVATVIRYFVTDVGKTLIDWGKTAFDKIKSLADVFKDMLGFDGGAWSKSWIEGLGGIRGWAIKAAAAFIVFKSIKSIFGGLLGKIPLVGRLFGGGGKGSGPKGTQSDPIYTKPAGGLGGLGSMAGAGGAAAGGGWFGIPKLIKALFDKAGSIIAAALGMLNLKVFGAVLKDVTKGVGTLAKMLWRGKFGLLGNALGALGKRFVLLGMSVAPAALAVLKLGGAIAAAATAGWLFGKLLMEIFPSMKSWGEKIYDLAYGDKEQTALDASTSDSAILDKINANRKRDNLAELSMEDFKAGKALRPGADEAQKSQVSIPYNYAQQESLIDSIGMQMSSIQDADKRKSAQAMIEESLKKQPGETNGTITAEENLTIQRTIADHLKNISDNTKKSTMPGLASRRIN